MNAELSILQGTFLPYQGKNGNSNNSWFAEWLEKMKIAFDDIEQLRTNAGSENSTNWTNHKLVTILLYKTMSLPVSGESCDPFDCYQNVFPEFLCWDEYFLTIYKLHLVDDFIRVYHLLSRSAKLVVLVHAKGIFHMPPKGDASLSFAEKLAFLISLNHKVIMYPGKACGLLLSTLNVSMDFMNKQLLSGDCDKEDFDEVNKWFREEFSRKINIPSKLDLIDFLSIFEIKNSVDFPGQQVSPTLLFDNVQCISEQTREVPNEFYEKLMKIGKELISCYTIKVVFNADIEDVHVELNKMMLMMEKGRKEQKIKQEELCKSDVIKYGLSGYQNVANKILKLMNTSEDWEADVEMISSNPNCAATKDNLQDLLSCLHFFTNSSDKCRKSLEKLWNVFFTAFKNMSFRTQTCLVKSFLTDKLTLELLNERALQQQKHSNIQERSINTLLNHIDSDKISEKQLSTVCYLLLLSPKLALEKMLYQGLNKAQQKFFLSMFSKLPLLFHIRFSTYSCICEYFCAVLNCFWINNDNAKFASTLAFLIDMLAVDSTLILSKDLLDYILKFSLFNSEDEHVSMPVDVGLEILLSMQNIHRFPEVFSIKNLSLLCYRTAAVHDDKIKLWHLDYSSMNVDSVNICKETLIAMTSKLIGIKKCLENDSGNSAILWLLNCLKTLSWKTQILCSEIFKEFGMKIDIPGCILDVCTIEDSVIEPTDSLSYGDGTGLIAWGQCFSECPPLCPVSMLKVHQCSWSEMQLFEKGWTVMLCQILPYSTSNAWKTLIEATRMLIIDKVLYIPYTNTAMKLPIEVNLPKCRVILSLVQIICNINLIIFGKFSSSWNCPGLSLYYTMQICAVMSSLQNQNPEFFRSGKIEHIYMLTQMFYCGCQLYDLLKHREQRDCIVKSKQVLVIFLLHVIKSVEEKMMDEEVASTESDSTTSESSIYSSEQSLENPITQKFVFHELIEIMQSTSSVVSTADKSEVIQMKLSSILENLLN